ncbi:hypothetical protein L202_03804 [Cryptococcus amylolentus CBS 6039]|uniref:Acyl-protein thioesterase 1 n=1 Tax=Cryptococcus amylolentus CBS 6039 TaxID=1295533 RepID=A0A1E3HUV2_9TREE|nr:hypothetical protein L202_03804 [Cryptococcus amylolentus CBS 6039]ODN79915.1 hypothetical protein L202_03804 [Cryptococcus amylolentus CBS 6039]
MRLPAPEYKTIQPAQTHQVTIIFLHGLGGDRGGIFEKHITTTLAPALPSVKWILPLGPIRPVTFRQGLLESGWFDVPQLATPDKPVVEDGEGQLASLQSIDLIIQDEVDRGTPESKIVLGGFSQGAMISLLGSVVLERRLAGIVALSGRLPLSERVDELKSVHASGTPIFVAHGKEDAVVSYEFAERAVDILSKIGRPVLPQGSVFVRPSIRFTSYPGLGHTYSEEELLDLIEWLRECLQ